MKLCLIVGLILSISGSSVFARNPRFSDFPEEPVSAFLKDVADVHEEVVEKNDNRVIGRRLRDYNGQDPVSNKLETEIKSVSKVGQPLDLKCKAKTMIKSCSWTAPNGLVFGVQDLPAGIKAVDGDEKTCHIQIEKLANDQLGRWTCQVAMDQVEQFQEAYLTATETVPITDVRLPNHAVPELYTIHLTPFIILDNFTIEGHVSIDIDVVEDADNITLHIKDIEIYENMVSLVKKDDQTQVKVHGHGYDQSREFYVVKAYVQAGQKYSLNIGFLADLSDKLAGFYRSTYQAGNETRYIATSHMEPTDARRALPCFDEPAMKAKFQMNLGRLKAMSSTSNMPVLDKGLAMADNDEYVWDTYETSVKMSTYLLAFVVSDFKFRVGQPTNNGVEFRIWSREEAIDQTEYAADIGPKILQYYEDYFNVPFPLPKQDMIAIPDFAAGAMENWGLITYRETALLHDPKADAKSRRIYVSTVVAHELAHQWFGDLVTMKWWDDLWLNEGFASYVETIGAAHVEPDASILERFCIDNTYDTFEIDSLKTSHPISAKVKHPDEINQIFDRISYGKGASIIRMMYHFLGEETFVGGLTLYLNRHKYGNAEQDDLWQALTEVAHEKNTLDQSLTVKQVMDTWTLQMGYPVLTVIRDYEANTMTIRQNRFMTGGLGDETDYKWWVPVTYDHQGGTFNKTSNDLWLKPDNEDLVIELSEDFRDKAVIVNVQQTGYFRVNYDEQNWKMIIDALETNRLSINRVNKGQIFNDLFNLAKEGQVSYVQAMDATKYFFSETDFIPWRSGLFSLKYIRLMLQRSQAYGLFKKYLTSEMVQPYLKLGLSAKNTDSIDDVDLRTDIVGWMCSLGYDDCQRQSRDLFKNWMDSSNPDENNPIDPSTRSTVYCQAIEAGDEKEWNFLWKRLKRTSNANERNTIFRGLACTSEVWILQRYLDMTLEPTSIIRRQDGSTVITSIARNSVGRYITWNWFRNNWDAISTYFDTGISNAVERGISAITQDFNTPFELEELEQFYQDHKNELGTARSATLNAIENVKANVKWMKDNYQTIQDWLVQNVGNDFSP